MNEIFGKNNTASKRRKSIVSAIADLRQIENEMQQCTLAVTTVFIHYLRRRSIAPIMVSCATARTTTYAPINF
jgi:hypothetical protein